MRNHIFQTLFYIQPFATITFLNTFYQWSQFLNSFQWWSIEKIEHYQFHQLQSVFTHAASTVPYYKQLFQDHHFDPHSLTTVQDIKCLPLLTKDNIRSHQKTLRSSTYPSSAFQPAYTGGTTGEPLQFYIEKARWLGKHFAFNKIYMQQAGYKGIQRMVSFAGKAKKIQHHPLLRTIELSTFHMHPDDLTSYWKRMQSYKPQFLSSYPSALSIFTDYLVKSRKKMTGIKAIFCHGETLTDHQRTLFEDYYDCRVYDQYGHREQCVFATTCCESNMYHINPAYGYVEILNPLVTPSRKSQDQGKIVATSLHNPLYPLIRYDTEDIGIVTQNTCECGRNFPLLKRIIGRKQDFLITKENHPIPLTGLYHVIVESSTTIRECQLFQDTAGELLVSIVTSEVITNRELQRIKNHLQDRFTNKFDLTVQQVSSIPRTKGGKFRYLIQKISHPLFD